VIRKQRQGLDIKYPSAKPPTLVSNDFYASHKPSEHVSYAAVVSGRYLPSEYHTMCISNVSDRPRRLHDNPHAYGDGAEHIVIGGEQRSESA
jgi:hypothetical protein